MTDFIATLFFAQYVVGAFGTNAAIHNANLRMPETERLTSPRRIVSAIFWPAFVSAFAITLVAHSTSTPRPDQSAKDK